MTRGPLDEVTLATIVQQLPAFDTWVEEAISFLPDFLSAAFPYDSQIPMASVALADCAHTLYAVRYALHEYLANGIYFREVANPPNESLAVIQEVYYLNDTALRLYSAAEHLAAAVAMMLDVTDADLTSFKRRGLSRWARVSAFLSDNQSSLAITGAFAKLSGDEDWKLTIRYRGAWVHNQPPTVHGAGLVYHRTRKWQRADDGGWTLVVRKGEKPEFTTDQLGRAFLTASFGLADVLRIVLEHYNAILEAYGIRSTPGQQQ